MVETTQGALIQMEHWLKYWCLPLNWSKCAASFFSADPHQANLQFNLLLFNSRLHFNPTPIFFGVIFDRALFFSKHVYSPKVKFFSCLKALCCISASSWGPLRSSFLLYEAFLLASNNLPNVSSGWIPFLSITNFTKLECLHRAASHAIFGCLLSSPLPILIFETFLPLLPVSISQPFLFQGWLDLE